MIVQDLINQLEALIEENEPHFHIMGEAEIMIDVFRESAEDPLRFEYIGISPHVRISRTADGVYPVLTAFEDPDNP